MISVNVHIHGEPAEVGDGRDGRVPYVTLDIMDDGNQVVVFFDDREELVRWLSDALAAAKALPSKLVTA